MQIKDWPAQERPRERLLQSGADKLTDAELLAIFLRTGVPGRSAIELSRDLLKEFGDLRRLLSSSLEQFCGVKGLGEAKYAQLQAVLELSKRFFLQQLQARSVIESPESVKQYLQLQLQDERDEIFMVVYLDSHHRVISSEELFYGTINSAMVYPRVLLRRVIEENAAAVIFAHNHPSGVAEPSDDDIELTRRLKILLKQIDVNILDHVIVGDAYTVSLAERGKL